MLMLKDRLQWARKNARLTQMDVVEKVKISQGTYSQLERGIVKSTTKIAQLADLFGVNPMWLSTGVGEAFSNTGANIQHNGDNYGNIVGGIGNTQNNLTQNVSVQDQAELDAISANHYKDIPLLDIDMGVKYALDPNALANLILNSNQKVLAFIPHTGNTFGVKLPYDIQGITPSTLLQNDILIIEPCIRPRDNDLVLVCLDYDGANRGIIARLHIGLDNKPMIKHNELAPVPMPIDSLICGVVLAIKRHMIDSDGIAGRLDQKWNILKTLVSKDKDDEKVQDDE